MKRTCRSRVVPIEFYLPDSFSGGMAVVRCDSDGANFEPSSRPNANKLDCQFRIRERR
jgi:hypothetical protein